MHTLEYLYNYFPKNIFDLKILHHNGASGLFVDSPYFHDKTIKLSSDIVVIQVNDDNGHCFSKINMIPFENPEQSVEILIPFYNKWISKVENIINYIEKNYNQIPKYILYVDGTDVVIINDILNPQEMLDFYDCDLLFNVEPNYMHTGFDKPNIGYYEPLYTVESEIYRKLNLKKYGVAHDRSLNAGIFLGKKDSVLSVLKDALYYMTDDYTKGFPYGCLDDQCMLRYLQNKRFNEISCDVYNKYFLFAYPKSIEVPEDNWEHFEYFKNKNIILYDKQ